MTAPTASLPAVDVAVVGAGPAGLIASLSAAERGKRVALCEQLDRPGLKLLATGGGRCNLTNTLDTAEFMRRFGRQGRFMQPALAGLPADRLRGLFAEWGVPTHVEDGGQVFPDSGSARSVQQALWRKCEQLGVSLLLRTRVNELAIDDRSLRGLGTSAGLLPASRVILATGGRSYPQLGATGSGYTLARQAGHRIIEPTPALVPLVTAERFLAGCAGVSVSPARVWIDLPGHPRTGVEGDLLITHAGLSGPAVLDLSGDVATELAGAAGPVPIRVSFTPAVPSTEWLNRLAAWRRHEGRRQVSSLLGRSLPASLVDALCGQAGLAPAAQAAQLSRPQSQALATMLTALPLHVTGTEAFAKAIVTRGGVDLAEIAPRTLASKRLEGLYLAGELLDLDGPCGGYNLQWAFASGRLAGVSSTQS